MKYVITKSYASKFYFIRQVKEEFYTYRPGDIAVATTGEELREIKTLLRGLGWEALSNEYFFL